MDRVIDLKSERHWGEGLSKMIQTFEDCVPSPCLCLA